ncbi:MAG: MBL fold metallo-hydrolase, partial [Acidobacteria bacterium]|nr:MBL fold metallo-hydrolase [Acidobacteriota bacterium]
EGFSDHADYEETLQWLACFRTPPRQVLLVHGEPESARALEQRIEQKLGWEVHVPQHGERMALH